MQDWKKDILEKKLIFINNSQEKYICTILRKHKKLKYQSKNQQNIIHKYSRQNYLNLDSRSCLEAWNWKKEICALVSKVEIGFLACPALGG